MDEEVIALARQSRELSETKVMRLELKTHKKLLTGMPRDEGRKRAATVLHDVHLMEIHEDNFELSNPSKRPPLWAEIRLKRIMLKEHVERINGMSEQVIIELRPWQLIEEEMSMVSEVICFSRLLSVGEAFKLSDQIANNLDISRETFDSKDDKKRPVGWNDIKTQRLSLKLLEDRLRHVTEDIIHQNKKLRAQQVSFISYNVIQYNAIE